MQDMYWEDFDGPHTSFNVPMAIGLLACRKPLFLPGYYDNASNTCNENRDVEQGAPVLPARPVLPILCT